MIASSSSLLAPRWWRPSRLSRTESKTAQFFFFLHHLDCWTAGVEPRRSHKIRREAQSFAMVVLDHESIRSMVPGRFFRDHKGAINSLDFHPTDDVMVTVGARPSPPALTRPPEIPQSKRAKRAKIRPLNRRRPPPRHRRRRHDPDVPHQQRRVGQDAVLQEVRVLLRHLHARVAGGALRLEGRVDRYRTEPRPNLTNTRTLPAVTDPRYVPPTPPHTGQAAEQGPEEGPRASLPLPVQQRVHQVLHGSHRSGCQRQHGRRHRRVPHRVRRRDRAPLGPANPRVQRRDPMRHHALRRVRPAGPHLRGGDGRRRAQTLRRPKVRPRSVHRLPGWIRGPRHGQAPARDVRQVLPRRRGRAVRRGRYHVHHRRVQG